jgi:thioredoxin-dependent peroxiredoxin
MIMNKSVVIFLIMLVTQIASGQIKVGDRVPDFYLPDKNGKMFHLHDYLGKKTLVIYFYPKDETKGCTAEACTFRDKYDIFVKGNSEVIGISADSPSSHRSFAQDHSLPFILLSDEKNEVRNRFGVPGSMLGLLPGRVTYVVDKNGIVKLVFNSQMQFEQHADEALQIINELK